MGAQVSGRGQDMKIYYYFFVYEMNILAFYCLLINPYLSRNERRRIKKSFVFEFLPFFCCIINVFINYLVFRSNTYVFCV